VSLCKVIKIILSILGKVTVLEPAGDVTMSIDPGLSGAFNIKLHNNGPKDIPVTFALVSPPAGVGITPTGAIAKPGDTSVVVTVAVLATAVPGEYSVDLNVSQ
jgi:hypothetical protein